jgi:hypothetical protein
VISENFLCREKSGYVRKIFSPLKWYTDENFLAILGGRRKKIQVKFEKKNLKKKIQVKFENLLLSATFKQPPLKRVLATALLAKLGSHSFRSFFISTH